MGDGTFLPGDADCPPPGKRTNAPILGCTSMVDRHGRNAFGHLLGKGCLGEEQRWFGFWGGMRAGISVDIGGGIWDTDPGCKYHSATKYDKNSAVLSAMQNHPKPGGSTRTGTPVALGRDLAHPLRSIIDRSTDTERKEFQELTTGAPSGWPPVQGNLKELC